jgi:glutathione S-transferase
MKLYNWQFAPNCRRVRMFILEKGLPLPAMPEVVVLGDALRVDPNFVSMWPPAMVPMLELDDGTRISEALAIVRYLEGTHPEPNLLGSTPLESAFVAMWERPGYDECIVGTAEVVRNGMEVFHDKALPGVPNESVPQIPALIERGKGRVRRYYNRIEKQLSNNAYVAGDRFTFADITNLCAIDFATFAGMTIPDDCPSVVRWHKAVSARPSAIASA